MANVESSTLTSLRQGFLESIGERYGFTTPGAGGAAGATLIDATNLINLGNDEINSWWVFLPLGPNGAGSAESRQVSDFVQSTGTITPTVAFSAQISASVSYELMKWHPTNYVLSCLNVGLAKASKRLGKQVTDDSLIGGNWLPGSDEDWESSSVLRYVTKTGAGSTLAKETTIKRFGISSAKLTRAGTDCHLDTSDTEWPGLIDLGGHTIRFEAWVYATVASRARLNVLVNGASVGTSNYHTGGSSWELLRTDEITITDSPASISFRRECNTGDTAVYFDHWRVISGDNPQSFIIPISYQHAQPSRVFVQTSGTEHGASERACDDLGEPRRLVERVDWEITYDNDKGTYILRFTIPPLGGRIIRLQGIDAITALSAETDTASLEPPETYIIYAFAAAELFARIGELAKAAYWSKEAENLLARYNPIRYIAPTNYSASKW